MSVRTPWGAAQYEKQHDEGITFYSTSSHGGFKLDRSRNAKVPTYMRRPGGWYEEDCEAAIVVMVFPEAFEPKDHECADSAMKNWFPDEYERFTGKKIAPGESCKRDEADFKIAHANDYVGIAAWGDWHEAVPEGMVGVCATIGGKRDRTERYFLVPDAEYSPGKFGFVVNPAAYKEIAHIT